MASGRKNQLTKQIGEYLVAAELCRRGLLATTFTGNVPHFDILALNAPGRQFAVQVKTINGKGSWQLKATDFVQIDIDGKKQHLGEWNSEPHPGLIFVFLLLDERRRDRFFIVKWPELQKSAIADYADYLHRNGGGRPRQPNSVHQAITRAMLQDHENCWAVFDEC